MAARVSLAGLRILLVEDEFLVSLLIEDILENEHCTIVGPFDRFDPALEAARSVEIDVAILDVNLAGTRSYPVAEVLTERNIPFVFLSGYGSDAVPSDHPEWAVCSKPFRPSDLVEGLLAQVNR